MLQTGSEHTLEKRSEFHHPYLVLKAGILSKLIVLPCSLLIFKNPQKIYVSLRLRVQNAVSAQPCVGNLGISLVLLNFLDCNFRLWLETP